MGQGQDKLLRVDQVARRLGVTKQHVHRLIRLGRLKAVRLTERGIRIPESALNNFSGRINRQMQRRIRKSLPPQEKLWEEKRQL